MTLAPASPEVQLPASDTTAPAEAQVAGVGQVIAADAALGQSEAVWGERVEMGIRSGHEMHTARSSTQHTTYQAITTSYTPGAVTGLHALVQPPMAVAFSGITWLLAPHPTGHQQHALKQTQLTGHRHRFERAGAASNGRARFKENRVGVGRRAVDAGDRGAVGHLCVAW